MGRHYISFKQATGIFEEAISPYKKWYQKSDMSLPIEIDGNYYRILRTTGPIDKLSPKKIVICNEKAELIQDEEITRKCLRFYVYLGIYEFARKKLKADLKQDGAKRYHPIIPEYKKMMEDLFPVLNEAEKEAMDYHLFYFKEIIRITTRRIELGKKVLTYTERIQYKKADKITNTTVTKIIEIFFKWVNCSYELQAILHEDGLLARDTVRRILKDQNNREYIKNWDFSREVIRDMDSAEWTAQRFIKTEREQRKHFEKWINLGELDKEVSDIQNYIKELRYTRTADLTISANLEEMMRKHWVFSSNMN